MTNKKQINNALKPYFKRLTKESFLKALIIGMIAGAVVGLVILALSHVLPIKIFFWHALVGFLISSAAAIIIAYNLLKPNVHKVAARVDGLGLNEKVQTMLELQDEEGTFARVQREDAINTLTTLPPRLLKLGFPKRLAAVCVALMVAFSLIGFLPNEHRQELLEKEKQLLEELEKVEDLLEKLEEEIEEADLSPELKEEVMEIVEELKEKLKSEKSTSKKLSAINEAKEKFEELLKKTKELELEDISDSLKENDNTKELGEAIEEGDTEKVKEELDEILEDIKDLEENELSEKLQELAESFENASENASNDLKESMKELANKLKEAAEKGEIDMSELEDMFDELGEKLEEAMTGEGTEIDNIDQLLEDLKKVQSESENPGENQDGSKGKSEGQNEGEGEGEGEGQDQDGGEGKGGEGNGSGAGKGEGKETKEDVSIYDPSLIGGDGKDEYVPGKKDENGNVQKIELGEAELKEGTVPYDEVFQDYLNKARQAIERESVPDDIRSLIEKYFSSLE